MTGSNEGSATGNVMHENVLHAFAGEATATKQREPSRVKPSC
jgi:hypothetical protein